MLQTHFLVGCVLYPHGHGLDAATRIKLAGYLKVLLALVKTIVPSCRGWRSDSKTSLWNSQNSSINKTPRCAKVTSPGSGAIGPPPNIPAYEIVLCGDLKGGISTRAPFGGIKPILEYIFVTSKASCEFNVGKILGRAFAKR